MSTVSEHHALIQVAAPPPVLGVHLDPSASQGQDESSVDLRGHLSALYDSRWLISGIASLVLLVAVLYALVAKSVYQADLTIHVEQESSNTSKNILSEASSLFETKKTALAEMELLRSRMVVSRSLDNLQLYIDVKPKYFPIIGSWLAKENNERLSEPGLFGYGGYIWGGETAQVSLFEVPDVLLGKEFILTSLGKQRFRLASSTNPSIIDGTIGLHYEVPTPDGVVELKVERMSANPGARFLLRRMSRLSMTEAIQNALVLTEQGKQSGIIEVKLHGENAVRVYKVLSEIGREYMRQNLARKTEEAEKSLAFLDRQLPVLKRQLEQAEDRYNQFRNAHSTLDLSEEARLSLTQAAAARLRRSELANKKAEMLVRFTEDHPMMAAVNHERKEIEAEIEALNSRIRKIPKLEQEQAQLTRDIKMNADLYTALSNTAQQLRLSAVGRVSNVRMVDMPILPERPIQPKRSLIVALAAVTGLFLGILVAFIRKAIIGGMDDPLKIERMFRARAVYATIPHSSNQDKLIRKAKVDGSFIPLLAKIIPEDPAVESLRSFRAAVHFSMPQYRNNIVMFCGPTRGVGKSFVTANFAAVMAASGKRVLLIDADLRYGRLADYFGVDRKIGLSDVILGKATLGAVIHDEVLDNLDFIATGEMPANCSELLLHPNFGSVLRQTSTHYDLVLLDTPPLLASAEALIIGSHAGAVFVVTSSNRTNKSEICESINRLRNAGVTLQGILLNDMSPRLSAYSAYDRSAAKRSKGTLGYPHV